VSKAKIISLRGITKPCHDFENNNRQKGHKLLPFLFMHKNRQSIAFHENGHLFASFSPQNCQNRQKIITTLAPVAVSSCDNPIFESISKSKSAVEETAFGKCSPNPTFIPLASVLQNKTFTNNNFVSGNFYLGFFQKKIRQNGFALAPIKMVHNFRERLEKAANFLQCIFFNSFFVKRKKCRNFFTVGLKFSGKIQNFFESFTAGWRSQRFP
jgi:hypothetical protein